MTAIPSGFPKSDTLEGALVEAARGLSVSQAIAIAGNSQLSRVIDTLRTDTVAKTITIAAAIQITTEDGPNGELLVNVDPKY